MRKAQVKDLIDASHMVRDCVAGSKLGLRFPSGHFRWVDVAFVAGSDASFAGEAALVHHQTEPNRSQRGRMRLFSSSECLAEEEFPIKLIS